MIPSSLRKSWARTRKAIWPSIKVDVAAELLHPVQLGDSTQVKVGQLAVTIGNPFGLQSTMTVGIISALGRVLPVDSDDPQEAEYTIPDIIQTDAPD